METKIYNIDFTGAGFERYAFPKEVVEALDKAEGSYAFLTCCLGCTPEDIGSIGGYFIKVFWDFFTLTPKPCEDMPKTDYNFLAEEGENHFLILAGVLFPGSSFQAFLEQKALFRFLGGLAAFCAMLGGRVFLFSSISLRIMQTRWYCLAQDYPRAGRVR